MDLEGGCIRLPVRRVKGHDLRGQCTHQAVEQLLKRTGSTDRHARRDKCRVDLETAARVAMDAQHGKTDVAIPRLGVREQSDPLLQEWRRRSARRR